MPINQDKFKEMVLYFSERAAEQKDAGFGLVKLNRLLYGAEFEAFRLLGRAIAGEVFERQEYGPIARDLPQVLDELAIAGRWKWEMLEGRAARADRTVFSSEELEVMEKALKELEESEAKGRSYDESAGWQVASENGAAIEYSSAVINPRAIPSGDLERAANFAADQGWSKAS